MDARLHELQQLVAHLADPDQARHLLARVEDRQQLHRVVVGEHVRHGRREQLLEVATHLLVARRLLVASAVPAEVGEGAHSALAVAVGGVLRVRALLQLHLVGLLQRGVEAEEQGNDGPQHARRAVQQLRLQVGGVAGVGDGLQSVLDEERGLQHQRVARDVHGQVRDGLHHRTTLLQTRRVADHVHQVLAHGDARVVAVGVGHDGAAVQQGGDPESKP